ncbi:sugar-phosphatase [Lonsdalea populi]|uniref:HAD family hydrolase n=1 Tax=Lonsdalea populi TaxID=1172565 RepID=A0A3N0ULI2_9GAMM|nr:MULTISPECIES: Cof-type HAD-IIB family hydrolase [Lonsdalea]OSN01962.1 sugar-phosphatase [Lonsdalea populi]QPQ25328.1 HAD family hydrolase [Lonsdalea populi]RAT15522.1 sugar-phosphatase [Lonsdalea quercina]RAT30237.1 sugar-phosphatase [Lonsdalea populi]RAT32261.1 sugar-phosphatase [Lonsdalea populi]
MIKMIAVDMDGTFLNNDKQFNKNRFFKQYAQMKQDDIQFVVASGNQYYQLLSFFPEIRDEIAFVAENGAYVVTGGQPIFCGELAPADVCKVIDVLSAIPYIQFVVCGKESAYVYASSTDDFLQLIAKHYYRIEQRDDFDGLMDTIFKFSLSVPDDQVPGLMDHIGHALDGIVKPVSSGFGFVDLIIPGVHKAHGIALLQQQWQIENDEVVAIGDSGNDYEMLQQAGFGVAMANAQPKIREVARYHTESNEEEGALNVIDRVLTRSAPFDLR